MGNICLPTSPSPYFSILLMYALFSKVYISICANIPRFSSEEQVPQDPPQPSSPHSKPKMSQLGTHSSSAM